MAKADTLDKIIGTYFAAVTAERFEYKGKEYKPKPLNVSAAFFHEFLCKPNCAGCCGRFTLDYLPSEAYHPKMEESMQPRMVMFNGYLHNLIKTYEQDPRPGLERFCDFVDAGTGLCGVHGTHPFSCDFETLRFSLHEDHAWLGVRPYGRGWNMLRVDGDHGAMCEFPKTSTEESLKDSVRKLSRLKEWTDHFGLVRTYIPSIIEWAENGPHKEPLTVSVVSGKTISKGGLV